MGRLRMLHYVSLATTLLLVAPAAASIKSWGRAQAFAAGGETVRARRQSRRAGAWLAAACVAAVPPLGFAALARPPLLSGTASTASLLALLAGAVAAILGGLSAKPRPTGPIALLCFGLGWSLLTYGLLNGLTQ